MYNDLILNASLLVALISLYNLLARVRKDGKLWVKILSGLLFGGVAIAGMRMPFHYAPGVIYDGRSIVLSMAGLFGGGVVTLVSVLVAGTYRAFLGGPGIWAGIITILFCGLTGLIFRRLHKNIPGKLSLVDLYVLGIVAHVVMLACQLLILPFPNGLTVISRIWMPILLIFPVATVLMGVLLRTEERNLMAYEEVETSRALYLNLIETSQDLIWRCDIDGCYTYLNPAWEKVFGYKIDEMLGKKFTDFQTTEYAERDKEEFTRLLQGNTIQGLETVHIGKDGREIHLVFNAKFLVDEHGNPAGTSGTAYDNTLRKQAEMQLNSVTSRQEAILAAVPDIIMEVDINKVYTWANQAGLDFFGEDVLGKEADFYFEGEQETYRKVQPLFNGMAENVIYVESWQRNKNGQKRLLAWWCRMIKDEGGKVIGVLSSARDITEQEQIEGLLRESEEKFRSLFNNNKAIMLLIDPDTQEILDTNPAASAFYGWSLEELIHKKISELNTLSEDEVNSEMRRAIREERNSFEFKHRLASGEIRDVEVYSSPIQHKGKTLLLSIVHDITERKLAENNLKENFALLVRTNEVTVDRELLMYELKKEVNALLVEAGKEEKYRIHDRKNK